MRSRYILPLAAIVVTGLFLVAYSIWPSESSDRAGQGNLQGGHGPAEDSVVRDAPDTGLDGLDWKEFQVQGVSVALPTSADGTWRISQLTDICDPLRGKYLIAEHRATGLRFRVDLKTKEITVAEGLVPNAAEATIIARVRASFTGTFTGDPRLNGTPRPTPITVCDGPRDLVPSLGEDFEPPPAAPATPDLPLVPAYATSTPEPVPTPSGGR